MSRTMAVHLRFKYLYSRSLHNMQYRETKGLRTLENMIDGG